MNILGANSELQGEALDNHMRALMTNKIANLFFLPAGQRLKASVIDFQQLTAVSLDSLQKSLKKRLTSLSQASHYLFLMKLTHHLTRPDAKDAARN